MQPSTRNERLALQRRNRDVPKTGRACDSCRTRKTKCNGDLPCPACVEHGFSCSYTPRAPLKRRRQQAVTGSRAGCARAHQHAAALPTVISMPPPTRDELSVPVTATAPPEAPSNRACQQQTDNGDLVDAASDEESLRETNSHTMGQEFYGPSGILTFLSRLRLEARRTGISQTPYPVASSDSARSNGESLVSYMHSPDPLLEPRSSFNQRAAPPPSPVRVTIERECVRLYFQNLHFIHPVLERSDFWRKCEKHVWSAKSPLATLPISSDEHTFPLLYDTVVALGAIVSAEDDQLFHLLTSFDGEDSHQENNITARALAAQYFVRAKSKLGDMFDTCSFNGVVTLLLMAVYCQNALKPHSCYMYTGMAVRAAFAMGIPMTRSSQDSPAARLWWAIYSVEIEMSLSAGRASALAEPSCYLIPMPSEIPSHPDSLISYMVPFAARLNDICRKVYNAQESVGREERSRECLAIDQQLLQWKAHLDASWETSSSPLIEPEWRTKQKLVCSLRFWNARIQLHRPFLLHLTTPAQYQLSASHIAHCVEASQATIAILYDAFSMRPWFRTWWYNSTYVLYATMVLLYVLLSGTPALVDDDLLRDAQRGLDVLGAMKSNAVAARCAAVIGEILEITRVVVSRRMFNKQPAQAVDVNSQQYAQGHEAVNEGTEPASISAVAWAELNDAEFPDFDTMPTLWNMVDTAFLDSLLEY